MLSIGYLRAAALLAAIVMPVLVFTQRAEDVVVSPHAKQLHDRAIVIDSHDDTTQRLLFDKTFDIGARHTDGNIDIPRMRDGGLDALFFSIWVPSDVTGAPAVTRCWRPFARIPRISCWRRPRPTSGAPRPTTRSPR